MRLKKVGENALQWLFVNYLRWIERTVTIRWDEENRYGDSQIFGFWHEDSFFMNLVLEKLAHKTTPVDVIVTADTRGNYIENMVKRCGGNALRVPDGYKAFAALKKIIQDSYEKTHSIAVALDGPLGPRHEPKKLAFYLSEHAEEDFVFDYNGLNEINYFTDKGQIGTLNIKLNDEILETIPIMYNGELTFSFINLYLDNFIISLPITFILLIIPLKLRPKKS